MPFWSSSSPVGSSRKGLASSRSARGAAARRGICTNGSKRKYTHSILYCYFVIRLFAPSIIAYIQNVAAIALVVAVERIFFALMPDFGIVV